MSAKSEIEWTDSTWNPVRGTSARHRCVKISPGCDFCYASAYNARYCGGNDFPDASMVNLGPSRHGIPLLVTSSGTEIDTVRLDEEILLQPLRWQKPRMVFVCSMTDIAGEWVPDEWLDKMWAVMALSRRHPFQVLTKRPKRLYGWLSDPETPGRIAGQMLGMLNKRPRLSVPLHQVTAFEWPLPHVMVGVTVELDRYAWRANTYLRMMPAAIKFVSAEPLLGPLPSLELECPTCKGHGVPKAICPAGALGDCDSEHDFPEWCDVCEGKGWVVDWLIVGGESRGPEDRRLIVPCFEMEHQIGGRGKEHCPACTGTGLMPRPTALDWVCDLRDRAVAARTNFFF